MESESSELLQNPEERDPATAGNESLQTCGEEESGNDSASNSLANGESNGEKLVEEEIGQKEGETMSRQAPLIKKESDVTEQFAAMGLAEGYKTHFSPW